MANSTIKKLYANLGFDQPVLLEKATEYIRMVQMRNFSAPLTETFKAAICLDLAATQLGIPFDKNEGKNFANTSMATYKNMYNSVEKILGLDRCLTVQELCVQLGIMSVIKMAEQIFNKYKEEDKIEKDFDHPQYIAVAVSTACQLKQIKVNKTQFLNLSRLKSKQWKELEDEFLKFAKDQGIQTDLKNISKKTKNPMKDLLEEAIKEEESGPKVQKSEAIATEESYEDWKERILREAYAELKIPRPT